MRIPLSWLREHVDFAPDAAPEQLLESLVSVGFEEEDIHSFSLTGPIVVGQVLEFVEEPQSNGKTIRWCQVDVGEAQPRGIVCGAGNFFAGDKVVVTLPGAVLPGPFPIAARKTYGHVSDGMIASAKELGLGDDHAGIIRLSEWGLDPVPGTDALSLLGLDDVAIEINVTPDRGYALALRGVAREYSHATGAPFKDAALREWDEIAPGSGFEISVDDQAPIRERVGASEFVARVVRNVDASRPTPPWLVSRLVLAGIRSVNILVDITNYVMLELGQPVHGYDLDLLQGGITVRRAAPGESLVTLDDKERTLHPEDLVITDDSGVIGLAGVMGGASTEMSAATKDVLIEAAAFDPVSIARTARRHKLSSEASKRFERGVDPLLPFVAARRVSDLLVELAGGTADEEFGGALFGEVFVASIELPLAFVPCLIGVDYSVDVQRAALELIGCEVLDAPDAAAPSFEVIPPSWRPDLKDKWSLAEEIARIDGYDKIPSLLPTPSGGRGYTPVQSGRRRVANALAAAGFVEAPSFPFVSLESNALFADDAELSAPSVKLANPLAGQASYLRRSLLPGLLQVAHRNISRGATDLSLFEIGTVFLPEAGVNYGTDFIPPLGMRPSAEVLAELNRSIVPQRRMLSILLTGDIAAKGPGFAAEAASLRDAIDAVNVISLASGVPLEVRQGERGGLHPGRTGFISSNGHDLGFVGEVLPQLSAEADLPGRVVVVELDLDALLLLQEQKLSSALSTFPAATQDLSLVIAADIPAADLAETLREGAGELLESLRLLDDYRGDGVESGQKSLTFALRFRADRTLTAAEASEARLAAVALAEARFGATMRD